MNKKTGGWLRCSKHHFKWPNYVGDDSINNDFLSFHNHSSKYSVCRYLIRSGADTNIKNKKGLTALHISAFKGSEDMVRMLVNTGCDVNTQVRSYIYIYGLFSNVVCNSVSLLH